MSLLLLTVFACTGPGTSSVHPTATTLGECKDAEPQGPPAPDSGGTATFSMSAEASGEDIVLHLVDVYANCCPSPGATASIDGTTITVAFEDVTTGDPCDCMCTYDFDVLLPDVGSGTWTLDVLINGEGVGSLQVTV